MTAPLIHQAAIAPPIRLAQATIRLHMVANLRTILPMIVSLPTIIAQLPMVAIRHT